jgi:hypothetical protein
VQWAEGTTGDEAHIFVPLGNNKAEKAQPVLMEAARRLGAFDPGSDLGQQLVRQISPARQFADGGILSMRSFADGGTLATSRPAAAPALVAAASPPVVVDNSDVVAAIQALGQMLLTQRPNVTAEVHVDAERNETIYRDTLRALQDAVPFGNVVGASDGFRRR